MQLRFCADTFLCHHIFMQYDFVPFIRPCFYAVTHLYRLCGHSFVQSFHAVVLLRCHAFTQLNPLRRRILMRLRPLHGDTLIRPHSYAAALFMQPCFYAVLDGNGSQGNGPEGGSWEPWGWPCPCAALWVSRPSQPAPLPAGRRRWNPGRIFHGWRPWCAPASPAFPAAG